MNIQIAAEATLVELLRNWRNIADIPEPCRSEQGNNVPHIHWMLIELRDGRIEGEKGHRWLGYAQGWLVARGLLTLGHAKLANKNA